MEFSNIFEICADRARELYRHFALPLIRQKKKKGSFSFHFIPNHTSTLTCSQHIAMEFETEKLLGGDCNPNKSLKCIREHFALFRVRNA